MKMLITGAASGIGLACFKHYIECGHNVIGIDKDQLDLSKADEVIAFVEKNNDFDVFIHCAGIREIEEPTSMTLQTWQRTLDVNLTSSFILSQGLIKSSLIKKKSLSIINISSVSGIQAEIDRCAYVTSKHALIGLTKQLAYQYGKAKIRVNAIAPGIIETPMTESYFKDTKLVERLENAIPVGYWGQTSNIIPLIGICISNNYLNGAVLVCDGGWSIGRII